MISELRRVASSYRIEEFHLQSSTGFARRTGCPGFAAFAKSIPKTERLSAVRVARGERGIWQRRYWEHTIRDDLDYARHIDYVHFNPVKHGHVARVSDWRYSLFSRFVNAGIYPSDWAFAESEELIVGERA